MKKYNKQILEAINRGIQLALDDYESEENPSIAPIKDTIKRNDSIREDVLGAIDLGLPSGTLWCKYNLGSLVQSLGKNDVAIDWYGFYFAWADKEVKDHYNSDRYIFDLHPYYNRNHINPNSSKYKILFNNAYKGIKAYDRFEKVGWVDMELEDDPAYYMTKYLDVKYVTPSREQFRELLLNTVSKNVYDYEGIKNLNGKLYTSKINGKSIFLPFCGYKQYEVGGDGKQGNYWTSSMSDEKFYDAQALTIDTKTKGQLKDWSSWQGFTIRPVVYDENAKKKAWQLQVKRWYPDYEFK